MCLVFPGLSEDFSYTLPMDFVAVSLSTKPQETNSGQDSTPPKRAKRKSSKKDTPGPDPDANQNSLMVAKSSQNATSGLWVCVKTAVLLQMRAGIAACTWMQPI